MIYFLQNNKWVLLVAGVCILLILPFVLFFSFKGNGQDSPQQGSSPLSIPQFFHFNNPTPTPFLSVPLSIESVSPEDKGEQIDPKTPIIVTFSRPVSPTEESLITVRLVPNATTSAMWNDDKTTLTLTPKSSLATNTTYTAAVIYSSHSSTWSFTTGAIPTLAPEAQKGLDQQTQLDQQWADYQNSIQQNFPWYDQLPLSGNTYFVTFETHAEKFTANLYPDASTQKQDTDRMKQEIQSQLENMGVDLKKYPIIWNVVPISPTPAP